MTHDELLHDYLSRVLVDTRDELLPNDPDMTMNLFSVSSLATIVSEFVLPFVECLGTPEYVEFYTHHPTCQQSYQSWAGSAHLLHLLKERYVLAHPDHADVPRHKLGTSFFFCCKPIVQNRAQRVEHVEDCLLYTSPSPRDLSTSRMPSSA